MEHWTRLTNADDRLLARDEVHHSARAVGPDKRHFHLLIVNISARGLMARCETCWQPGDKLTVTLPVLGVTKCEIRWSLGGRIGCELDETIALSDYFELLSHLMRRR